MILKMESSQSSAERTIKLVNMFQLRGSDRDQYIALLHSV
jgi:hypothetical protein